MSWKRTAMLLAFALVLTAVACEDDEPTQFHDAGGDVTDAFEPDSSAADGGTDGLVVADASDVSEDTVVPPDAGPDVVDASDLEVAVDLGPDLDFPDLPPQVCVFPNTDPSCPDGPFGPATFVDSFVVVPDTSCCRDFTGNGFFDNKVGGYLSLARFSGVDVNTNIANQIQSGALVYLIEYQGWDNEMADPDLDAAFLLGTDYLLPFTNNLAGTGDFEVSTESYDSMGAPRWALGNVTVLGSHLRATGGTVDLNFPGLIDGVRLTLSDVTLEADVEPGADLAAGGRVALSNGTLSGAVDRDTFFNSLNAAANGCPCLNKDVFAPLDAGFTCVAEPRDVDACNLDPGSSPGCSFLADRSTCNLLAVLSTDTDVDLSGDGRPDAYSIGVQFTGVGAGLVGTFTPP